MRVLLDTHAFIWWVEDRDSLSPRARKIIEDSGNVVLVSAASAWELASKVQLGKFKSKELVSGFSV